MFDPRAGVEAVRTVDGHGGIKGSRVVWAGDRDRIITTGVSRNSLSEGGCGLNPEHDRMQFSKMSDRQVALWETGSLGNLKTEAIDSSASVGWRITFLSSAADRWGSRCTVVS
jgi:coronin-1B/1C/6